MSQATRLIISTTEPADPAALCHAVVRAVSLAATSGDALDALFTTLREGAGATALALEITADSVTRLQPYGDIAALIDRPPEPRSATTLSTVLSAPVSVEGQSPGRLLAALPVACDGRTTNVEPLLQSAALLLSLRLEQEALARRADDADRRAEQKISEVAAIYEIGQAIDQIEHASLLQLITERAASLMAAQACSLMVVQEKTRSLRVAASTGLPDSAIEHEQAIGEGIAGRVALTEQPMLIVGDIRDPRLVGVPLRPDISSSMLVPMKDPEGRVLGVLAIRRRRPARDFDDIDLKVFSVFATQAALALTNKQLYDNLERRAAELLKISDLSRALISTLDLDELLRRVAEDICQIVGFDRCCLYLRDSNRRLFTPRMWRGYSDTSQRNPVREGEGALGMAAKTKQIVRFDGVEAPPADPEADRAYRQRRGFARSLGVAAFVAVPLLDSKNRCLGVVVADNRGTRRPIPDDQVSLLSAFVNQAGIAIENARLYDTTQENLHNIYRLNSESENILQSIGACILSTDAHGVVTRWNRAAETTLGISADLLRGAQLTGVIMRIGLPPPERDALLDMVARVQETGLREYRAKWTLHPGGRLPMTIDLHLARLVDYHQERAGVVLTFEDVTKEEQMEAEMDRMRRLADIGQLAAKMAHEVRNALSPIKGAAQIIRLDMQAQSASTEWPDIIVAEVDGLSRLTSEMLDFARTKSLDRRSVRLEELLTSAIQSLAAFMSENRVDVRLCLESDLPPLSADPTQLGQVVRNIAMNAAQSMPDGGPLTITAGRVPDEQAVVVRFRDEGGGIRDEDIERIFRPFVTTRPKGTGLGLAIVQKIVNQHGGRVEVESRMREGTCFSVYLPIDARHDLARPDAEGAPLITSHPVGPFPDN
ncbi:MAG TPA: GAF domain-containing protein [Chthonomonadaceae bacterium]|nr:GAF domain-containing protein [Chthonomonadaceae bacterium]